jgi:CRISPR/Cas system CSM-associated protein Csm4 (group 5 of RAMP superfamily)
MWTQERLTKVSLTTKKKLLQELENRTFLLCDRLFSLKESLLGTEYYRVQIFRNNGNKRKLHKTKKKLGGLSLQAQTIPTERPPLVSEVSANFSG